MLHTGDKCFDPISAHRPFCPYLKSSEKGEKGWQSVMAVACGGDSLERNRLSDRFTADGKTTEGVGLLTLGVHANRSLQHYRDWR